MILVYLGRWSYGRFKDDNNIYYRMKHDLTTGTWQGNIWCPIIIILLCTSNAHQVQPFLDMTCYSTFRSRLTGSKLENKGNHWPIVAISVKMLNVLTMITRSEIKYYWWMNVSSAKQSPHMAKSHGLSLQLIWMELSGFNLEPEQNDLASREYNHLQMIFYKLKKSHQDHKFYSSFSNSHKILRLFDSNTILTSSMTSRIVWVNFFSVSRFFCMIFTSDSFLWRGECHRPWHYGRKHSLLNVTIC